MAKRKGNPLKRKTGSREYRAICWVSAEGQTEKDYLQMDIFRTSDIRLFGGSCGLTPRRIAAQQCTQMPQNGVESPFSPICVHSCATAHTNSRSLILLSDFLGTFI